MIEAMDNVNTLMVPPQITARDQPIPCKCPHALPLNQQKAPCEAEPPLGARCVVESAFERC
jgi:hypothetical protein